MTLNGDGTAQLVGIGSRDRYCEAKSGTFVAPGFVDENGAEELRRQDTPLLLC